MLTAAVLLALSGLPVVAEGPISEAPRPSKVSAARGGVSLSAFPFTDVTELSGVDFVHENGAVGRRHYPETMAPGLALFDADGDDDLDLYVVNGGHPTSPESRAGSNRLFLNRGDGTFDDASQESGAADPGWGMGAVVGDYDGDGDADLYVLNFGPNVLYRNRGGARFEPVSVGLEDPSWSVGGAFLDFDSDGDLDLFVTNYIQYDLDEAQPCQMGGQHVYCSPLGFEPSADHLFRNEGGRFRDVSLSVGLREDGRGMGIAVADFDADGDQDLFVANDKTQNFFYRNTGGHFEEEAVELGLGFGDMGRGEGSMGAVALDAFGTEAPALFVTNYRKEPNRLYQMSADGLPEDRTMTHGLGSPSREMVSWGMGVLDIEGDGDQDLAVANGHVYDNAFAFSPGTSWVMPDHLLLNDGEGRFDVLRFPGPLLSSRGIAVGDLDGDGDQELVVTSCGDRLRIWRNDSGRPERFVLLKLIGRSPNTDAYGAVVTAHIGGLRRYRRVTSGGGYASHSDARVYLGLGDAAAADRVRIRWPDGSVEEEQEIRGGQVLIWRQGEGIVSQRPLNPSHPGLPQGGAQQPER